MPPKKISDKKRKALEQARLAKRLKNTCPELYAEQSERPGVSQPAAERVLDTNVEGSVSDNGGPREVAEAGKDTGRAEQVAAAGSFDHGLWLVKVPKLGGGKPT